MFTLSQPIENCYLFEFDTQKDLTLSFFRVQEYYESDKEELKGKIFTTEEFLESMVDDKGNIEYFSFWEGFNVPGVVYNNWSEKMLNRTTREDVMYRVIKNLKFADEFYIIGALKGDKNTIDHEVAHALYYLNSDYRTKVIALNFQFYSDCKGQYDIIINSLTEMGYDKSVHDDEIQAYMSTSTKKELTEELKLEYNTIKPLANRYSKVLRKYNNTTKVCSK